MLVRGMGKRRDDLAHLHRLIAVVESCHARLSARGADTTDAARLLAKLRREQARLSISLGNAPVAVPHRPPPRIDVAPHPCAAPA